jgi:two-component system sensor histidine kinase GlrK
MKVSNKIIAGFLILMLLAVIVLANQLSVIHQMQAINRDLSEIDMNAASAVLRMEELAKVIKEDSQKYFATGDSIYDQQIADLRQEFQTRLDGLKKNGRSGREHAEVEKLATALEDYWNIFNRIKKQDPRPDPDYLPIDLTIAVDHLEAQTEIAYEAVKGSVKDQVARAADAGQKVERVSWLAGVFSLLLGAIVAAWIVRSINDPLRRLTCSTRAIARGEFWHRLPAHGGDEFSELARDFNVMTEKLGELDRMKKDFVSHVSHDLKAPLASIRQIMHLLLQGIPGSLNEQQKELLELSYDSAERLAAMVGNLLDVSRMEAGSMEYDMAPHDLVSLAGGVIREFDVQARQRSIRLSLETDRPELFAECDRERIVQVIGNLLENALKFSPEGSEIVTLISALPLGEGDRTQSASQARTSLKDVRPGKGLERGILVSVSDSGPGIPDEHKRKIFEKFHQIRHGKKAEGQGVGLGLAICRTIIEAHSGQIWVEDNPNGGSVFSFILQPAAREEVVKCGQTA